MVIARACCVCCLVGDTPPNSALCVAYSAAVAYAFQAVILVFDVGIFLNLPVALIFLVDLIASSKSLPFVSDCFDFRLLVASFFLTLDLALAALSNRAVLPFFQVLRGREPLPSLSRWFRIPDAEIAGATVDEGAGAGTGTPHRHLEHAFFLVSQTEHLGFLPVPKGLPRPRFIVFWGNMC